MSETVKDIIDRIEAAHKREREAGAEAAQICGEIGESIGRASGGNSEAMREVAELRECLKEAIREKCPFTRMSCRYGEQCDYECGTEKWRNALKGSNNATK